MKLVYRGFNYVIVERADQFIWKRLRDGGIFDVQPARPLPVPLPIRSFELKKSLGLFARPLGLARSAALLFVLLCPILCGCGIRRFHPCETGKGECPKWYLTAN